MTSVDSCSVQKDLPRHTLSLLCRLAIVPVVLTATPSLFAQPPSAKPVSAPVFAGEVRQLDVTVYQTFVSTVTPTRTSEVGSPVEGQVVEFLVREGDFVKQGATLAQLRPTKLEIQKAGAAATLELLKSQLQDLQDSRPIEIAQAKSREQAANALKEFATQQYERGKNLGAKSPVTTAELEELESVATSAVNVYNERAAALELAETTLPMKIAQAEVRIRVQEETINELKDAIEQHTILAPFDGYVTKELTEVGQWISKGGPVAEIVELNSVDIILPVVETYISGLRAKSPESSGTRTLAVAVEALPGEKFDGEVVAIVPKADYQARTFPVKVRVENRLSPKANSVMLKPGMFARVTLPVRMVDDAVMVPKDALVLDVRAATVWVVVSPDEADKGIGSSIRSVTIEVDTSVSEGDLVQVVGPLGPDGSLPLRDGDVVITEGNERVTRSSTVTIKTEPTDER